MPTLQRPSKWVSLFRFVFKISITSGGINGFCHLLFVQLHFIENYLREFDPRFDNLCAGDQFTMKEALYIEVNRWAVNLTQNKSITVKSFWEKGTNYMLLNIGSPWHPTSFGACGPSSRLDSPPLSLGTWWVLKYSFAALYVFTLEWEKKGLPLKPPTDKSRACVEQRRHIQ